MLALVRHLTGGFAARQSLSSGSASDFPLILSEPIFARMKRGIFAEGKSAKLLLLPVGLLLATLGVWLTVSWASPGKLPEQEPVELALRRAGHYLLKAGGDSTTRIPPIEKMNSLTWRLRLEHYFPYDQLPKLLNESFKSFGVQGNYNVIVLDCTAETLQLGYNFQDFQQSGEAPCQNRETDTGCHLVQVHFVQPQKWNEAGWAGGAACFLLAVLMVYFYQRGGKSKPVASQEDTPADEAPGVLRFGNSSLQPENQLLISAGTRHELTYREAKLLQLFASNPNRLLERDYILQQVWADEGILVGRSIDVFVSRLRKLLREDPTIRIVTVHGVGYRLETNS